MPQGPFNSLQTFNAVAGQPARFYSLPQLEKEGVGPISRLPVSIRIVLESVLRNCDSKKITEDDVRAVVDPDRAADPRGHLQRLAARFPGTSVTTRIEDGDAASRICDVAEEVRAETIVLGNRGTQGSRWHVRESIPNLVLRHAPCSVYIVDTRRAQ